MKELLKEKLELYTYEKSKIFKESMIQVHPQTTAGHADHESVVPEHPLDVWNFPDGRWGYTLWIIGCHNRQKQPFPMWETHDNGFLIYTNNTAVFFSDDHHIHKLTKTHLDHDWLMHEELYKLCKNTDDLKIEIPVFAEKLNNGLWYTEVIRPEHKNLIDIHQVHIEENITPELIKAMADNAKILLTHTKQVFDKHKLGCFKMGGNIVKFRLKSFDPFEGIWTDFKHWDKDFNSFVAQTYAAFYHYLNEHRLPNIIPDDKFRPLLDYVLDAFSGLGVDTNTIKTIELNSSMINIS